MAKLLYPTSEELVGPILLEESALTKLDEIISEYFPRLVQRQDEELGKTVETEISQYSAGEHWSHEEFERQKASLKNKLRSRWEYRRENPEVTIYFRNGKRLTVSSFKEAALHPEVMQEHAKGFAIKFRCGSVEAEVKTQSYGDPRLELTVTPDNDEIARTLFGSLSKWLREVAAPKWQQIWASLGIAVGIAGIVLLILVVLPLTTGSSRYWEAEARKLIEEGITEENTPKAIETILAIVSKSPARETPQLSNWVRYLLIGGILACFIVMITPPTIIGIGKSATKLRYWRWWIRVVFISIPAFIASTFILPMLIEIVQRQVG